MSCQHTACIRRDVHTVAGVDKNKTTANNKRNKLGPGLTIWYIGRPKQYWGSTYIAGSTKDSRHKQITVLSIPLYDAMWCYKYQYRRKDLQIAIIAFQKC